MAFETITLAASQARTTTGNSGSLDIGRSGTFLNVLVNVTAASGTTPTLDLKVQWSHDGTNFADPDGGAASFVQITAAKTTVKQFPVLGRYAQLVWTVGGTTPSFTFAATGMSY